jgi:hypothetical protein
MVLAGLGIRQRSVLLILMAEAVEVANPDLAARWGVTLEGAARRHLNDMGLVTSRRVGRSFTHELTDKGWRWCDDELAAGVPPRAGSAGGALYAVLGGVGRYLQHAGLGLGEVFGAAVSAGQGPGPAPGDAAAPGDATADGSARAGGGPPSDDVEARVRDVYRRLAGAGRDWVSLAAVRAQVADLRPEEVDAVLIRMARRPDVRLAGEPNRKALSDADHAAAVQVGGEDRHLLAIEAP